MKDRHLFALTNVAHNTPFSHYLLTPAIDHWAVKQAVKVLPSLSVPILSKGGKLGFQYLSMKQEIMISTHNIYAFL